MRIDESREMDAASRRTFGKLTDQVATNATAFAPYARNLFHNGQFNVSQRTPSGGAIAAYGASVALADRWFHTNNGTGVQTLIYTGAVAALGRVPEGRPQPVLAQYIQMTTADAALAAGDFTVQVQWNEGVNVQHLEWGTSRAKPITLSFDFWTNVAGTFVVEMINNGAAQRVISRTFSATAAQINKYQTVVITFPGDTGQALSYSTGQQLGIQFAWAAGSTYTSGGTLNTSWNVTGSVTANRLVGVSNTFPANVNNAVSVTNVQLEVGSVATPYEVRPYIDELAICQRYFRIPGPFEFYGNQMSTTSAMMMTFYPQMRVAPAITQIAGTLTIELPFIAFINLTALGSTASSVTASRVAVNWAAASGAIGYPCHSSNAWVQISAEI